jgi:hypothetical protein
MQGLFSFLTINVNEIRSSLTDPLSLVCLIAVFFGAFGLNWVRGLIMALALAAARTVISDYQHFSPGVPPSFDLVYVFTSTLVSVLIVFFAIKLLRALWRMVRFRLA